MSRKRAISPCAIVVALIYLKRLKIKTNLLNNFQPITNESSNNYPYNNKNYEKYSANCLNNTELCLISLLLASKYLVDEGEENEIYNDEWAELLDYSVEKVNLIERSILKQLVKIKTIFFFYKTCNLNFCSRIGSFIYRNKNFGTLLKN